MQQTEIPNPIPGKWYWFKVVIKDTPPTEITGMWDAAGEFTMTNAAQHWLKCRMDVGGKSKWKGDSTVKALGPVCLGFLRDEYHAYNQHKRGRCQLLGIKK